VRDIKQNEEICISYVGLDNLNEIKTPKSIRQNLRHKWGIVCSKNCLCFDESYWKKIQKGRELERTLERMDQLRKNDDEAGALASARKLQELEKGIEMSVIGLRRTVEHGFQILTKQMNSVTLMLEFVANELLLPTKEDYDKHQTEENGRGNKNRACQSFCAYRVRVIPGQGEEGQ